MAETEEIISNAVSSPKTAKISRRVDEATEFGKEKVMADWTESTQDCLSNKKKL